jgi:(p)ppGpp synthase/HD superfamily hydrolase
VVFEEEEVISAHDADALAQRVHGNDRNRSGVLYIDDVRRVAARFESDPDGYAVPTALLHDTVEKTEMDWDALRAAGADDRLIGLLDALTERDHESEQDYLIRSAADPLTLRINGPTSRTS